MCRQFLKEEVNWRIVQSVLIILGILVAGIFAFQQNRINEQLLDLNFRTLVGFQYDEKSGMMHLYNYGDTPVYVGAARMSTSPEVKFSIGIQKTIFPKQSIELNFREHLTQFLSNFKDNYYGGVYHIFLQTDTLVGKKSYVGWVDFSLTIKNGNVENIVPSNDLFLVKYNGTLIDFVNND